MKWNAIGHVLQIEGVALRPGTWTDMNGTTVTYSEDLFSNPENIEFTGRMIKRRHGDDADDVVGFLTGWEIRDGELHVRGYVWDPEVMEEIRNGNRDKMSIEATVDVTPDGRARKVYIEAVALVERPAVKGAGIYSQRRKMIMSDPGDPLLNWIKAALEKAGIDQETINLVIKALSGEGYPYPYPAPVKMEEYEKLRTEKEELEKLRTEMASEIEKLKTELGEKDERIRYLELVVKLKELDPDAEPGETIEEVEKQISKLEQEPAPPPSADEKDDLEQRVREIARELGFEEDLFVNR